MPVFLDHDYLYVKIDKFSNFSMLTTCCHNKHSKSEPTSPAFCCNCCEVCKNKSCEPHATTVYSTIQESPREHRRFTFNENYLPMTPANEYDEDYMLNNLPPPPPKPVTLSDYALSTYVDMTSSNSNGLIEYIDDVPRSSSLSPMLSQVKFLFLTD